MQDKTKKLYAQILEIEHEITIIDGEIQIDINESEEGWNIQCYSQETIKDSDDYKLVEYDGGLCTGNALDAVEFMLPIEVDAINEKKQREQLNQITGLTGQNLDNLFNEIIKAVFNQAYTGLKKAVK